MADVVGITIVPNRANATAAGVELAFVTEQVAEAYAKAIATGATPVSEPHQTAWGQTVSYVRDLNGILVEICSPVIG
jgi:uncharacterized glyoxalase superfamily protein PhnB